MDAEGWGLFNAEDGDAAIQRDDEAGVFPSDDEAIDFVRLRAYQGSEPHQKAYGAHCANPLNRYKGRLPRNVYKD